MDPRRAYRLNDFKNISKEQFDKLENNKLDSFLYGNGLLGKYDATQLKSMVATGKIASTELYNYIPSSFGNGGTTMGEELIGVWMR